MIQFERPSFLSQVTDLEMGIRLELLIRGGVFAFHWALQCDLPSTGPMQCDLSPTGLMQWCLPSTGLCSGCLPSTGLIQWFLLQCCYVLGETPFCFLSLSNFG